MLDKLFTKNAKYTAAIPQGTRVYAIGDIHGSLSELRALLNRIRDDGESASLSNQVFGDSKKPAPSAPMLVFLGDYVDRGPDSKVVLDSLIQLQTDNQQTVFLMGNHEAAMLDFLAAPRRHSEWLHWGGAETLESYGVANVWSREEDDLAADLAAAMPPAHRDFLETLDLHYQLGDYFFVHAGVKPGVALAEQEAQDLLWIRDEFHQTPSDQRPDKTIIHGHHPVKKPQDQGWRINVDTGACWSGMLSAVVLEGTTRRFLSTG